MSRGRARNRQHGKAAIPTEAKALTPGMAMQLAAPSAGRTMTMDQVLEVLGQTQLGNYMNRAMPRDPRDDVPFGPAHPLAPAAIDPVRRDTQRPDPRVSEYPVAWNLPGNSRRLIAWEVLRAASRDVDIMRRCVELRKDHIAPLKWSFTISPKTVNAAYEANPAIGKSDLLADLRRTWAAEIGRLTDFWEHPWRANGLNFKKWVRAAMEERLVLDAVVVRPDVTYGGDVRGLELIDGATIKPLLDYRGIRPSSPFPAFQQELYGFPRGEFSPTFTENEAGQTIIDGAFLSDQMFYQRDNVRLWTPYGYSPVEQALNAARLYMKRMGWMLSEYDDGVLPQMIIKALESLSLTPNERREYEDTFNDEMTGQTAARHRAKFLFPGTDAMLLPSADERYKPDYDLFLIKKLASPFGISMTSLGYTESKGLGSSGMHEAQADSEEIASIQPDEDSIADLINDLSTAFLRMPPEIAFSFVTDEGNETLEGEQAVDLQMKRGSITLNDDRRRLGVPLYTFPEADMPGIVSPSGWVPIEGSVARMQAADKASQMALAAKTSGPGGNPQDDSQGGDNPDDKPPSADETKILKAAELRQWRRFIGKSANAGREFEWRHHTPDEVNGLTTKAGDPDDPKAPAGPPAPDDRWPAWAVDVTLANLIAERIRRAMIDGVDTSRLADAFREWAQHQSGPLTENAIRSWVTLQRIDIAGAIGPAIREGLAEGYVVGSRSAAAVIAHESITGASTAEAAVGSVKVDWGGWKPGNVRAARLVLSQDGTVLEFQKLLDQAGVVISRIEANRLDEVAMVLADGLERGETPKAIAVGLRGVVDDAKWALMVAHTETNRAQSAAALATYKARGITRKEWFTALDQRVCKLCRANEDEGAIDIDSAFASGESAPPAHPRCRCALLPGRRVSIAGVPVEGEAKGLTADVVKVGPHGYVHGWIFVGVPGVGNRVMHPHHGHGTVGKIEGSHVHVDFDNGKKHSFEAKTMPGASHFEARSDDPREVPIAAAREARAIEIANIKRASDATIGYAGPDSEYKSHGEFFAGKELPEGARLHETSSGNSVVSLPEGVKKSEPKYAHLPDGQHRHWTEEIDPRTVKVAADTLDSLTREHPIGRPTRATLGVKSEQSTGGDLLGGGDMANLNIAANGHNHEPAGHTHNGMFMDSHATAPKTAYVISHEYGHQHARAHGATGERLAKFWQKHNEHLSRYGQSDPVEGYAEAFAEWANTNGKTPNPDVKAFAQEFGWSSTGQK